MHQKKSELQIGKESRGFSSDYCRLVQDDFISTPHKRGGSDKTTLYSLMQMKLSQTHQSAMEQHIKSTHSKLTRTPSSLLRSPTIKSGIDSFHSLEEEETADAENYSKTNKLPKRRSYRDDILLHNCKKPPGFRFQLLLPPVVVVVIPCFWYYIRAMQNRGLNSSSDVLVLGLWFDSFSALVFVTAVVISLKIAFPDLKLGFRLPSMRLVRGSTLGQSWGCLAVSWAKPLAAYLSDERHRRKIKGNPSVTWTIGSKPKCERSKIIREGVEVYSNGDVYEGEFHQGKCSGSGVYYYYVNGRNGDTYAGEYFADKMHGFGVYNFANGHRYEGAWHEGRKQGLGMYTFRNSETQSGHWHCGVLETHSTQNPQTGLTKGVNHSKVLNAVQEARCAAGKAFEVPRVDDRVNKAIAAANKAATAARVAAVKAVQKRMHGDVPAVDI